MITLTLILLAVWIGGAVLQIPRIIIREHVAFLEKRDEIQETYDAEYESYKTNKQRGSWMDPPTDVKGSLRKAEKARNRLMRTFAFMSLLWPVAPFYWVIKNGSLLVAHTSTKTTKATWRAFWNHFTRKAEIKYEVIKEFNAMKLAEMTAIEQNAASRGLEGKVEEHVESDPYDDESYRHILDDLDDIVIDPENIFISSKTKKTKAYPYVTRNQGVS